MSYETFIDALRLFDAVTASVVFGVLCYRGRRFWRQYTNSQKWIWVAFTMYVFAIAYSSFELYAQEVETGIRSYVILVANIIAIYALMRHSNESIVTGKQVTHV